MTSTVKKHLLPHWTTVVYILVAFTLIATPIWIVNFPVVDFLSVNYPLTSPKKITTYHSVEFFPEQWIMVKKVDINDKNTSRVLVETTISDYKRITDKNNRHLVTYENNWPGNIYIVYYDIQDKVIYKTKYQIPEHYEAYTNWYPVSFSYQEGQFVINRNQEIVYIFIGVIVALIVYLVFLYKFMSMTRNILDYYNPSRKNRYY